MLKKQLTWQDNWWKKRLVLKKKIYNVLSGENHEKKNDQKWGLKPEERGLIIAPLSFLLLSYTCALLSYLRGYLSSGCSNKKYHSLGRGGGGRGGGLWTTEIYFLQFWRLGGPRSRCQQIWCLLRTRFLGHRRKEEARALGTSVRALIPFTRAPPSRPHLILVTSQRHHPQYHHIRVSP